MSAQGRQDSHRHAAHEVARALHAAHAPHALQAGGYAVAHGAGAHAPTERTRRAGAAS